MLDFGLVNATADTLVTPFSSLTRLVQALGGLVALSIIFGAINVILNRKRMKELKKLRNDIKEIKSLLKKKRN